MRAVELAYYNVHRGLKFETDFTRDWARIEAEYTGPNRHYHNLDHIEEMCNYLWETYPDEDTKLWIIFAAIYHDIVDPSSKTAEEDSAQRAVWDLEYALPSVTTEQINLKAGVKRFVKQAILSTKTHQSDEEAYQRLIDADLLRFAAPLDRWGLKKTFADYSAEIRQEYSQHPDSKFIPGRKAVLEEFLARDPFFYHLEGWFERYEGRAQDNIREALK